MIDNGVETNLHLSRVATWLLNTIGKAIALSVLAAFVVGVVAAVTGEPLLLYGAGLAGPLTFALVLYSASAPLGD